jgi:hypothetical protein
MGDGTTKTTTSTAARLTMSRFLFAYNTLVKARDLPFPVRHAPGKDSFGKVSGSEKALFSWQAVNGNGRALYSWRAEISDYVWCWDVGWDRSQPWDSPVNHALMWRDSWFSADGTPMPTEDSVRQQKSFSQTVMVAIVGPGTAFGDGRKRTPLKGLPGGAVLLVESRHSGIPWPAPGDFDIRTMPHTINAQDGSGISGQSRGGFIVLFADGQAWFLSEKVPFETLAKFFTIEGAKTHGREKLLGPFALDRLNLDEYARRAQLGQLRELGIGEGGRPTSTGNFMDAIHNSK